MTTLTPEPTHTAPDEDDAVCWLLDLNAYGITAAANMHPDTDPWPAAVDGPIYTRVRTIIRAQR